MARPQSVQPIGVRRLNRVPLYIIGVVAAFLAVLLSWVAFDKNKPPTAQSEDHGGNTDSYAAQVVGNKVGYFPRKIAEHQPRRLRRPQ
jgi:hypothetical protein